MVFSANPLSLSVTEPAFESWLRDSGYLEILDEQTTNLDRNSSSSPSSNSLPDRHQTSTSSTTTSTTTTSSSSIAAHGFFLFTFSYLGTISSLFTLNPFSKLTTDDFSGDTPSWTVGFIGIFDSYSFPSSPSQAKLRVHENVKRYARNYATLFILFFACALYQMPVSLLGLLSGLALWDLLRLCSSRWELDKYPSLRLTVVRFAQCATGVILYCSNVQMALFCAIAVSYAVMILHASLRKLSPSKQPARGDNNKSKAVSRGQPAALGVRLSNDCRLGECMKEAMTSPNSEHKYFNEKHRHELRNCCKSWWYVEEAIHISKLKVSRKRKSSLLSVVSTNMNRHEETKRRNDDSSSIELRKRFVSFREAERSRQPTVIYVETPEIIYADAQHFMSLVQKLTGKDSKCLNITNNTSMLLCSDDANSDRETKRRISSNVVHQPSS